MKEFNIDLVIDKTFNVFADSIEEAKEKAIEQARRLFSSYNSLSIDFVEEIEDEDLEFENEYDVYCFNPHGTLVHIYSIEADHTLGAATAAEEFFASDFPNETLATARIFLVGDEDEAYSEYSFWEEENKNGKSN
jgi:DNA-dependent RNA polymerase auxiliary subunit epsilon